MAFVVSALSAATDVFWDEWFWLPEGILWKDLEEQSATMYHPAARDLKYVIFCAAVLFIVRKIFERYIATSIGRYFSIREAKPRRPSPNNVLENSYKYNKMPAGDSIQKLSKQTDMPERKVERWFRMRRNQDRPTMMKRFTEAAWRFTFYFSIFVYGVVVLWDKSWFSDSINCWVGYPHHHIPTEIFWYYMIEIGFYSSLMFSQFIDVKRKDFWEMFFHHIATLLLLCFSWCGNFVRVGTLVLVIHDAVDYWMEAAKMSKYIKAQRLCDVLFAIFGIVWFITRLVIFPIRVMWSTSYELSELVGIFPSMFLFNGMLCVLLVLHCYWFSLIARVAYAVLTTSGEEVTDIRSSTEEAVSEEENGTTNNHVKHKIKASS